MKSGYILIALLTLLLICEGCTKTDVACEELQQSLEVPTKEIEAEKENSAASETDSKITPYDEAKCMASAKKWVKEAEGLLEEALAAQQSATHKVGFMCSLIVLQGKIGDREAAMKNFDRALDLVREKVRPEDVDHASVSLAISASEAGLYERAKKAAEMTRTSNKYAGFSRILSEHIARKDFAGAIQIARESGVDSFYVSIALAQAEAGLWDDAKEMGEFLIDRSPHLAISTFCAIAKCEVRVGDKEAAEKSFARAREILEESESIDVKDYRYASIAKAQAEVGLFESAEKDLRNVRKGYGKYPALIILAESKYKAGDKKTAAEYLDKAKEDAQDRNNVRGLCSVAVAESKFASKEKAWKTIQEAREIYADMLEKSRKLTGPWMFSMESRSILRAMFEAGFREEAFTDAQTDFGVHKDAALAEIAILYAQANDFARAHQVLRDIDDDAKSCTHSGLYYDSCLGSIANLEIAAGVTSYIPELFEELQKVSESSYLKYSIMARLLSENGLDVRLMKTYESIKDKPADKRFYFCLGAAEGYLKRAADAAGRDE